MGATPSLQTLGPQHRPWLPWLGGGRRSGEEEKVSSPSPVNLSADAVQRTMRKALGK